jgi:hypothetical protein
MATPCGNPNVHDPHDWAIAPNEGEQEADWFRCDGRTMALMMSPGFWSVSAEVEARLLGYVDTSGPEWAPQNADGSYAFDWYVLSRVEEAREAIANYWPIWANYGKPPEWRNPADKEAGERALARLAEGLGIPLSVLFPDAGDEEVGS